jgi:hypothetical protein
MERADLLGAWSLVSWSIHYPDGRTTQPFGSAPRGLIIYSPDGWMTAVLTRAPRSPFDSSDMRAVPIEERARAFDEYLSYTGRWRIEGDTVVHDVDLALNPQLMGTVQIRRPEWSDAGLTLHADELMMPSREIRRHVIRWQRPG